jgi:nucleoside-diphosphate-sugar epimerase
MRHILVTGSSGHLGEALVRTLRAAGHRVLGLDLKPSRHTDLVGSISDPATVARAMDGAARVLHTATLHKPHVASHTRQQFIDVNVLGTSLLLDAAVAARVDAFIYTSTTSAFGDAMAVQPGEPAAWIDEAVVPRPKNIYGVTKVAAEDLCALAHRNQGLACLVLRTSRFFLEEDDDEQARTGYVADNLKACEFLYRRVDIEDVVSAHLCALERAPRLGFRRYVISATTPFARSDLAELARDAPAVVSRRAPGWEPIFAARNWRMLPRLTRVYDNARARAELGWQPQHDFAAILARNGEILSPLAREIGKKGYHPGGLDPITGSYR